MFSKWDLHILSYKIPICSYKIPFLYFDFFLLRDLARLPGLLCLGSAELVLPCSLPCFALPWPSASLTSESASLGAAYRVGSLMRLAGVPGKAKQGRLQDETKSAEPRQSKPGSRANSGDF